MLTIGSSFSDLHENVYDAICSKNICCAVQNEENETIFRLCSLDTSIPDLIFRSRRRNQIRSICFSSDFGAAIVQQDDAILDFLILTNGNVSAEFQQPPKFFKDASFIIGFNWLADRQLAIITDAGVEFCSLNVHRKSLKLLKSFAHSTTSWFICFPDSKLFLFACGAATNFLYLISFQNNTISNIGSINVDFGYSAFKPRLLERDVCISSIYGHICILILKFDSSNGFATGLNIFEFPDEKQPFSSLPIFKYLIKLELFGLVGVQINHYLPELLLKIVADAKMWTCLQQLLQYRVIDDSKFLAFELISLSDECPSLYQIALDMFNRRGNTDQISEALLCRGHVIDALRFTTANGGGGFREGGTTICNEGSGSQRLDKICLKLLNSAWIRPNDRPLRYTIYSYLQTNGKLKSLAESDDADFERFSRDFHSLYSSEELKEAETSFRLARLSSIRGRNRRDSQREESFCSANSGDADILE
uniref:Mic1 domain-containing protein n=1 Tax=Meloidogyne javanica TaxID=6303 RepID=A0A915LKK7_MELJA